jgi:predicted ribosomally synthesized peptide with nif11-like leader
MSVISAKAFIEKVKDDEDFREKLGELKDGKERMEFIKAAGFDFTKEEIAKIKEEEGLTDEELDNVAGGCGGACIRKIYELQIL